jgi:hypothetical protein
MTFELSSSQVYQARWNTQYRAASFSTVDELVALARFDLCPSLFCNGRRGAANFHQSYFLYGDVDSGPSISEFVEAFGQYEFFLLTSKSHRKPKHGVIADRYHVLLPAFAPYVRGADLDADLRLLCRTWSFFDPAVSSCAQFFNGNVETVGLYHEGQPLVIAQQKKEAVVGPVITSRYVGQKTLPWILAGVRKGCPGAGRQDTCYRVTQWALREGHPLAEVQAFLAAEFAEFAATEPSQFRHALRASP